MSQITPALDPDDERHARELFDAMREWNLDQQLVRHHVAKAMGVSQETVGAFERGELGTFGVRLGFLLLYARAVGGRLEMRFVPGPVETWDRGLPKKFWVRVNKTETCWLWTWSLNTYGYAQFSVHNKPRMAHRIAYEALVGPIPEGLQLDHLCRVRHCVNPDHLEPVTLQENLRRGLPGGLIGAAAQRAKTHCVNGHEYTEANTHRQGGDGPRRCRTCLMAQGKLKRQRAAERAG